MNVICKNEPLTEETVSAEAIVGEGQTPCYQPSGLVYISTVTPGCTKGKKLWFRK
ncbi:hypothetical protein J2Y45_001072 [Dyadobacter sp. BE34]|uniref:Uncharacterized protein n=1 Tax=Dyadobacter fermentans TaxID=94254 RepID=A0ABU1QRK6_9BACT|nr:MULTISPECIES: hypothetical protein [Dyadobacter]MDR6803803.1 hypothetical protein [Dyadobacter fermentans]MDR7041543.1 hypothetical protein [Dyadobacter sp. BE242]MDR7195946.1 hypothetical protein [Dyadobacter sp. BE34]MDR7213509.1 hypothetical protein [Dyadobacter sp. BE31]MDR7261352.1 hypothetical protein [Dyadobacter sp. BE32]